MRQLVLATGFEITRVRRRPNGTLAYSDVEEIVARLLADLKISDRYCVDIAAADGRQGSNTYPMFRDGWEGLAVEVDPAMFERLAMNYLELPRATLHRGEVTPANVVSLLASSGAPEDFAFLSLDIDGYDHDVLEALLTAYRPQLMCVEINEKIPPPVRFARHYTPNLKHDGVCYGQSLSALNALAGDHGYVLLDLWYQNAILAPVECGRAAADVEDAYKAGYLERPDRLKKLPWNEPLDVLQAMSPDGVVSFLEAHPDFVANQGAYDLTPF